MRDFPDTYITVATVSFGPSRQQAEEARTAAKESAFLPVRIVPITPTVRAHRSNIALQIPETP